MDGEFENPYFIFQIKHGSETKMKKFSFNLKFLDRFKKSKKDSTQIDNNPIFFDDDDEEFEEIDISEEMAKIKPPAFRENTQTNQRLHSDKDLQEQLKETLQNVLNASSQKNNQESTLPNIPIPTASEIEDEVEAEEINFDELEELVRPRASDERLQSALQESLEAETYAEKTLNSFNLEKFRQANQHLENDFTENDITNPNVVFEEMSPPNQLGEETKSRFNLKDFKFPRWSLKKNSDDSSPKGPKNFFKFNDTNWNELVISFFSPGTRPRIHATFLVCLLGALSFYLGKGLGEFLGKNDVTKVTIKKQYNAPIKNDNFGNEINKIAQTNLFNIKSSENYKEVVNPKNIQNIICNEADKPSDEGLKLLDTIVLQDSVKSVASVQMRGQADLLNVREGEQITNSLEVSKIARLRVILKNLSTGECEYISAEDLDEDIPNSMKILPASMAKSIFKANAQGIKNQGNTFKIKKTYRDQMIGNMSEILTQAKAVQITNPDGSLSFKMTEVIPGSIYSQLNIQNDDIITNINGKKIENLNELMGLLGRIKEIDHFQIGLRRNGINENLEYNFE